MAVLARMAELVQRAGQYPERVLSKWIAPDNAGLRAAKLTRWINGAVELTGKTTAVQRRLQSQQKRKNKIIFLCIPTDSYIFTFH